mmetsp:Transcript_38930/g.111238  ORF Transcript_38930/g.111238 Transcript_38930/m.111238 type:complete len:233 (+) Transcript_38930:1019-1717(+)
MDPRTRQKRHLWCQSRRRRRWRWRRRTDTYTVEPQEGLLYVAVRLSQSVPPRALDTAAGAAPIPQSVERLDGGAPRHQWHEWGAGEGQRCASGVQRAGAAVAAHVDTVAQCDEQRDTCVGVGEGVESHRDGPAGGRAAGMVLRRGAAQGTHKLPLPLDRIRKRAWQRGDRLLGRRQGHRHGDHQRDEPPLQLDHPPGGPAAGQAAAVGGPHPIHRPARCVEDTPSHSSRLSG